MVQVIDQRCAGFVFFFVFGAVGITMATVGIVIGALIGFISFIGLIVVGSTMTILGFTICACFGKTEIILDEDSSMLTILRHPFTLCACCGIRQESFPLDQILDVLWITTRSKNGYTYRIAFQHASGRVVNTTTCSSNTISPEVYRLLRLWLTTWIQTHRPQAAQPVVVGFGNSPQITVTPLIHPSPLDGSAPGPFLPNMKTTTSLMTQQPMVFSQQPTYSPPQLYSEFTNPPARMTGTFDAPQYTPGPALPQFSPSPPANPAFTLPPATDYRSGPLL